MSKRRHHVILKSEEETRLREVGYSNGHPLRKVVTARALLKVAAGCSDRDIAESLDLSLSTVIALRKRFATLGLDACMNHKEQERRYRKITGDVEARIIKIACGSPPDGRARWTLSLLADRAVELGIVESISDEAVRLTLKKTNSSPISSSASASRPRRTASL